MSDNVIPFPKKNKRSPIVGTDFARGRDITGVFIDEAGSLGDIGPFNINRNDVWSTFFENGPFPPPPFPDGK